MTDAKENSNRSLIGRAAEFLFSTRYLRAFAWASLVSQILIVVTGGVVRLTGSGLGCPTWPKCTAESLVTVPEMGLHGIIEFANRMLTFVLVIIAVATYVSVRRLVREKRRGLHAPALWLGLGIPMQAVLGGITVLTKLNPWLVGAHFVLSAVMIWLASLLLFRVYEAKPEADSPLVSRLATPTFVVGLIAVLVGVLVTGAGPHSGDADTPRNGLDLEIWQHFHSYPGYLMFALIVASAFVTFRAANLRNLRSWSPARKTIALLLLVTVGQIIIGISQARLGVPALLVGFHMLGASMLVSLLSLHWLFARAKRG